MSNNVIIVAQIIAKEQQKEEMLKELKILVAASRSETACIQYDLHHDNYEPNVFVMYEIWENATALQEHLNSNHFLEFRSKTKDYLQELEVREMTKIH